MKGRQTAQRIRHAWRSLRFPSPDIRPHPLLAFLGSPYGGWHFIRDGELFNSTIVSAGLGEDASFDIAMASIFQATVILVDPTPRAIRHFEEIQAALGCSATEPMSADGRQPIASYNLERLSTNSLKLIPAALANTNDGVRLFAPRDPSHVSFSITDFQNGRKMAGDYLDVPSVTFSRIMAQCVSRGSVSLVKLDIEGAENQVIPQILAIRPRQILVEFDDLQALDRRSLRDWERTHSLLVNSGYQLAHVSAANFCYADEALYEDWIIQSITSGFQS